MLRRLGANQYLTLPTLGTSVRHELLTLQKVDHYYKCCLEAPYHGGVNGAVVVSSFTTSAERRSKYVAWLTMFLLRICPLARYESNAIEAIEWRRPPVEGEGLLDAPTNRLEDDGFLRRIRGLLLSTGLCIAEMQ